MPDQSRALFPVTPNVLTDSLATAHGLLNEDTLRILALERARYTEATAMAAVALTDALGISPSAAHEVQTALVARVSELAQEPHRLVNQCLGYSALTLARQPSTKESTSDRAAHTTIGGESQPPQATMSETTRVSSPPERIEQTNSGDKPRLFGPADMLRFAPDIKFADYDTPNKNAQQFIADVFKDEDGVDVSTFSAREVSLIAHQLITTYMVTPMTKSAESHKEAQKEQMELFFALHGPALTTKEISKRFSITSNSLRMDINRIKTILSVLMSKDKIEQIVCSARGTARFGSPDLFVVTQQINADQPATPHRRTSVKRLNTTAPAESIRKPKEYVQAPANMRNFLTRIYPAEYDSRLIALTPSQAIYLTQQLIAGYRVSMEQGKTHPDTQQTKLSTIERWTGLYENPMTYAEIARKRAITPQAISSSVRVSIGTISRSLEQKQGFDKLLKQAKAYTGSAATKKTIIAPYRPR